MHKVDFLDYKKLRLRKYVVFIGKQWVTQTTSDSWAEQNLQKIGSWKSSHFLHKFSSGPKAIQQYLSANCAWVYWKAVNG